MAAIGFIAALQSPNAPPDLRKDVRHRAATLAAAPAIDKRLPFTRAFMEQRFQMRCDVACDQRRTQALRLERRNLRVQSADARPLFIV